MGGRPVQRRETRRDRGADGRGEGGSFTSEGAAASRTGVATTVMGSRTPPRRAETTMRVMTGCGQASTRRKGKTGADLTAAAGRAGSTSGEREIARVASLATSMTAAATSMAASSVRTGVDRQSNPKLRRAGRSGIAPSWLPVERSRFGRLIGNSSGASSHRARQ